MPTEENKTLTRRLLEEGLIKGDLTLVDELIDPNFVNHNPDYGTTPDRDGMRQYVNVVRGAFPDIKVTINDLIAEEDKVVARMTAIGTHQGDIMGIPPTGKQITLSSIVIISIVGGKVVERWAISDRLSTMQQLGILPSQ